MTFSKGGVPLSKFSRKRRKNYPLSWGCPMEKMKMKKRVLTVWDGPRRLTKDDMMLSSDFEVRVRLPGAAGSAQSSASTSPTGPGSYVTDLDVQTMKRAEAFHAASQEEKGPWIPTNYPNPLPNNNMAIQQPMP